MKIVNVEEMRAIEQASDARGHSYAAMMDMAGKAVAEAATALLIRGLAKHVLVLIGPGNNGGDGLVAARNLVEMGTIVAIYIWRRDIKGDKNFQQLKRAARRRGLDILWADNDPGYAHLRGHLEMTDLVIDALLGTGASRPIEGKLAEIMAVVKQGIQERRSALASAPGSELGRPLQFPIGEAYTLGLALPRPEDSTPDDFWDDFDDDLEDDLDEADEVNELDFNEWLEDDDDEDEDEGGELIPPNWPAAPVLAVDLPTGLNADSGELDPAAIPAQLTVTFAYLKWGQVQYPGAGACGILAVADIGVPEELAGQIQVELARPANVQQLLPGRPADANKGTFGKTMIVAGSLNYTGAAYLCGSAAGRAGAGLVTLAVPAPLHAILAASMPETTWLVLPDEHGSHSPAGLDALAKALGTYRSLLLGPGLTTQPAASAFVEQFLGGTLPSDDWRERVVADADCLNILAQLPDWPARLPAWTILTPHPGEMSRLTGLPIAEINSRRIETARRFAATWGHVVLLKGAYTVIAAPDGRARVLPFAVPALATAGSGDVLAGAIAAMLAQGLAPFEAAICGSYVHGHAGLIAQRELGPAGVVAGDILQRLPQAQRQLRAAQS